MSLNKFKKKQYRTNLKNDCIAITMWFWDNQGPKASLNQCAKDTGIPYPTVYKYVMARREYGPNSWFLSQIAYSIGYYVEFVGKHNGWLVVNKVHFERFMNVKDSLRSPDSRGLGEDYYE